MAMVKNNKGFSLVEVMVAIAVLGLGAGYLIHTSKLNSNNTKLIASQDIKSYLTKEILTAIENKSGCNSLIAGKTLGQPLTFMATDGSTVQVGSVINKTHNLKVFNYNFPTVLNLPSGYKLVNIHFELSPITNPKVTIPQDIRLLTKASASSVSNCISPRDDGGELIQDKAITIAKTKVCTEDLKGTMTASGKCSWPEPRRTEVITIQL